MDRYTIVDVRSHTFTEHYGYEVSEQAVGSFGLMCMEAVERNQTRSVFLYAGAKLWKSFHHTVF
jgi:hypothetical protein